jgi:hypothetical protein
VVTHIGSGIGSSYIFSWNPYTGPWPSGTTYKLVSIDGSGTPNFPTDNDFFSWSDPNLWSVTFTLGQLPDFSTQLSVRLQVVEGSNPVASTNTVVIAAP